MTISLRAAGTATAATAAVTAINPSVPAGTTTNDISVLTVWMKPFGTTITTPAGWTKISEATNGSTAAGVDTGSTKIAVFVRESAPTGAIGNISFAGSPNSCGAVINSYQSTLGGWDVSQFTTGGDTTDGANYSATGAGGIAVASGDWVVASTAVNGDVGTLTAFAIGGMSGATLGTHVNRTNAAVTTGNDTRGVVGDTPITAGSSSAAPTFTYTNASTGSGTTLWLRLRDMTPTGVTFLNSTNMVESSGNATFSHTPSQAPQGIVVCVSGESNGTTQPTTAVTYGGVAMTKAASGAITGADSMYAQVWFLGASIPTGAQTVSITSAATFFYVATCFAVKTSTGVDTEVTASAQGTVTGTAVNTSMTIPSGKDVFMAGTIGSDTPAVADVTDNGDLTRVHTDDHGSQVDIINRRTSIYTGTGSAYTNFSWTGATSQAVAYAVAAIGQSTTSLGVASVAGAGSVSALVQQGAGSSVAGVGAVTATSSVTGPQSFSDDFNRANAGSLGSNWENTSNYSIVSNRCSPNGSASAPPNEAWSTPCATSDNFSQITVTTASSSVSDGVVCRGSSLSGTTFYLWRANGGVIGLFKVVSGTYTNIGTDASYTLVAGDVLKISATGSTIVGYLNGTALSTVTDTAITSGTYVGIRAGTGSVLDDWYGGDGTGPAGATINGTAAVAGVGAVTAALGGPQNLFSGTPSIASANDSGAVSLGAEFYTTTTAWLTKVRFLMPNGSPSDSQDRIAALYSTTDGTTGTKVGGDWTITAPSLGAWGTYTLPTPLQLTANTRYRIAIWHPGGQYSATSAYFSAGAGGTTTTLGGFLVLPNSTDALLNKQGSYDYAGSGVTFPVSVFNAANYYSDVEVTNVAPPAATGVASIGGVGSTAALATQRSSSTVAGVGATTALATTATTASVAGVGSTAATGTVRYGSAVAGVGAVTGLGLSDLDYAIPYEGSNGVALSNGSGGGDTLSGVLNGNATFTFDTSQKAHGTSSARMQTTTVGATPTYSQHTFTFGGQTVYRTLTSLYVRVASRPDFRTILISYTDMGGNRRFGLGMNADGTLTVGYGASTDKATSTMSLSLDTWYRLEFLAESVPGSPANTILECNIYSGDSTTILETVGGSYTDIFTLYTWNNMFITGTYVGGSSTSYTAYYDSLQVFWGLSDTHPKTWPTGGVGVASIAGAGSVAALGTVRAGSTVAGVGAVTAVTRVIPSATALAGVGAVTALGRQGSGSPIAGVGAVNAPLTTQRVGSAVAGVGAVSATANVIGAGVTGPVRAEGRIGGAPGNDMIIPFYIYPTGGSAWDTIIADDTGVGYIIVNDRSGSLAGQSADANYSAYIASARAAGVRMLYYVDTNYTAVTTGTATANMAAWVSLYGAPDGWFFDQAASAASNIAYYQTLYTAAAGKKVVLNHGTTPDELFLSTAGTCDVTVLAEHNAGTIHAWPVWPSWLSNYSADRYCVLAYDATNVRDTWGSIPPGIKYRYVADTGVWYSLPSFYATEVLLSSSTSRATVAVTASVAGVGTVTNSTSTIRATSTVAGVGATTGDSSGATQAGGTVLGVGSTTALAGVRATGSVTGTGAVSAPAQLVTTAAVAGVGATSATGSSLVPGMGTAAVVGAGAVAANGSVIVVISATASVTGTGAVVAVGAIKVTTTVTAAVVGTGLVVAVSSIRINVTAGAIVGRGTVTLRNVYIGFTVQRFTTPTRERLIDRTDSIGRRHMTHGVSVLNNGGIFTEQSNPSDVECLAADYVYMGGRTHVVSAAEAAALQGAGYSIQQAQEWIQV